MRLFTITLVLIVLLELTLPGLSLKRIIMRQLGNYQARVVAFHKCEGLHPRDNPLIQLSRINSTTVIIKFEGELIEPFDDSYSIAVDISVWGNGGWKPNFYNIQVSKPCSELKKNLLMFSDQFTFDCPQPAVKYKGQMKNNFTSFPILPRAPYGTFLGRCRLFTASGVLAFCRKVEFVAEQNLNSG